jgi:hypothetical protein
MTGLPPLPEGKSRPAASDSPAPQGLGLTYPARLPPPRSPGRKGRPGLFF